MSKISAIKKLLSKFDPEEQWPEAKKIMPEDLDDLLGEFTKPATHSKSISEKLPDEAMKARGDLMRKKFLEDEMLTELESMAKKKKLAKLAALLGAGAIGKKHLED
jgi:hypothetical protein